MSWVYVGVTAVSLVAGADQANNAKHAANKAAAAQNAANDAAIAQQQAQFEASQALQQQIAEMEIASAEAMAREQMGLQRDIANQQISEVQRQFGEVQRVLAPFITAGNESLAPLKQYEQTGLQALSGQKDLIGLNGSVAQSGAIGSLANSPEMAAYLAQGEGAILQNAAATGGLRGGNTQAALAQFRPSLLAGMISQQYDRLGGLAGLGSNTSAMLYQTGQSAAAGVGNAGMQTAGQVGSALAGYSQGVGNAYGQMQSANANAMGGLASASAANSANMANAYGNYYNNQGSIAAGNALAQGNANSQLANSLTSALGSYTALQAMRGGGLQSNANTAGIYSLNTGTASSGGLNTNGGLGLRGTW